MNKVTQKLLNDLLNKETGRKLNIDKAWFDEIYSKPFNVCVINGKTYPCETIEFEMI